MKKSARFIILSLLLLSCSTIRRHKYEKIPSKDSNYDISEISPFAKLLAMNIKQ